VTVVCIDNYYTLICCLL